mgnify:CR=1 FL=1
MLSPPRVIVIDPQDVRTYLEETTNTVYQCMKEQGGHISLMVIREIVENFIHAHFAEPIISILDGGDTIRFADQGPGIDDKERAFDFGVTSANSKMKRYIRGTGAGFPMVQEYLENAGGAVSIEDNMGNGTVVTVSLDPKRVQEIERAGGRGAAVRPETEQPAYPLPGAFAQQPMATQQMQPRVGQMQQPGMLPTQESQAASMSMPSNVPEAMPLADQDAAAMQQATGAPGGQQMGYQPYQQGYPYQQMPPLGYGQQFPQQYQQGYLGEYVSQVLIPTEKVYQVRNGKKIVKERSYLPGYVLVEAALVGEVAHHLRNITNVIGFLGGQEHPVPLRQSEVNRILGTVDELQEVSEDTNIPYTVGETVKVSVGPFSGFSGIIEEVSAEKRKLKVMVKIFGRKTPLELGFTDVEKE